MAASVEVRDLAQSLLVKYRISFGPVNVYQMLWDNGIEVIFEDEPKLSGACISIGVGEPTIYINTDNVIGRQRFTAAHELKHALLDGGLSHYSLDAKELEVVERTANSFAAELLMPRDLMEQVVTAFNKKPNAYLVSRAFGVSVTAAAYRLSGLSFLSTAERDAIIQDIPGEQEKFEEFRVGRYPPSLFQWLPLHLKYMAPYGRSSSYSYCSSCKSVQTGRNEYLCWRCGMPCKE